MAVPKPREVSTVVMEEVTLVDFSKKMNHISLRWLNAKPLVIKSLVKVLDKEENSTIVHIPIQLEGCPAHTIRGGE